MEMDDADLTPLDMVGIANAVACIFVISTVGSMPQSWFIGFVSCTLLNCAALVLAAATPSFNLSTKMKKVLRLLFWLSNITIMVVYAFIAYNYGAFKGG